MNNSCLNNFNKQKGITLYLGLIILATLLGIALGITPILIGGLGLMRGMGYSVVAFYGTDTGIERSLYNFRKQGGTGEVSGTIGELSYSARRRKTETHIIWESVGLFRGIKRAIEITIPR